MARKLAEREFVLSAGGQRSTTRRMELVALAAALISCRQMPNRKAPAQGELRSALVIEDCRLQQRAYARVLRSLGYRCAVLETLREALAAMEAEAWARQPFGLVISDLRLPDGEAMPIVARAQKLDPKPILAVVTGYLDASLSLKLTRLGAMCFPKPFELDHVKLLIGLFEARQDGGLGAYARRYALSPREREALRHALDKRPLDAAAKQMRISVSTLREYWTRIFEKTGHRSQRAVVDSIARISTLPPPS